MRLLLGLAVLGLLGSAVLAPRVQRARPGRVPLERFVDADPRVRAERGEADRQLGVALAGYEDLVLADPGDPEALRRRIRAGILIGAVAYGQPGLDSLVRFQITGDRGPDVEKSPGNYLDRRREIDPDGSFLQGVLEEWVQLRLHFDTEHLSGFYASAATAIYLAARGESAGVDKLRGFTEGGEFYEQFFPYVRRYHPAWPAVEPLAVHYLQGGNLAGRVEAGVTVLEYHVLFGKGGDLLARVLPDVKAAIKEVRGRLRNREVDVATSSAGRSAVWGMGLLAALGEPTERELLDRPDQQIGLLYDPFADAARVAQVAAGIHPIERYTPGTQRFQALEPQEQLLYFVAAAVRGTRLPPSDPQRVLAVRILENGFDTGGTLLRVFCLQAINRLDPELGRRLTARAVNERGTMAVYGVVLSDAIEDPVPITLPAIESFEPDLSALAAVTLLERLRGPGLETGRGG